MGHRLGKRTEWYRANAFSRPGERGGAPFFFRCKRRKRERRTDDHTGVVASVPPGDYNHVRSLGKKRTKLRHSRLYNIGSTMAWTVVEGVKRGRPAIVGAGEAA